MKDKTPTESILRFMLKSFLMTLPVLIPAIAFYIWADPFMAVRTDREYFPDPAIHPARVGVNKGVATFRGYNTKKSEGRSYNAFVFGSSISCSYDVAEWTRLLEARCGAAGVRPFHFDSSSETLVQMAEKAEYLYRRGDTIGYALVVLDPVIMSRTGSDGPYSMDPLELHPDPFYFLRYHYAFFRASTNADFFKSWLPARISGVPSDIGRNRVFEPQPICYDPVANQESLPEWDRQIANDPDGFYRRYPLDSPATVHQESPRTITGEKLDALAEMSEIFRRSATDFQIIVGPNRRKVTLNKADRSVLDSLFGASRVHDFSLSLCGAACIDTLFYDNIHYRPVFATRMMRMAYGCDSAGTAQKSAM